MDENKSNSGSGRSKRRIAVKKLAPLLVVIAGVVILAAIRLLPAKTNQAPQTEAPPVDVEVQVISTEPEIADTLDLPGVVEPSLIVRVAAEVAGRIDRIAVEEGQPCQEGMALVYLNADLARAEFERASAQARFDEAELERKLRLYQQGAATGQEVDEARAKSAVSRATTEAARTSLDRATIAAPISGILNDLPMDQGEYVLPGMTVAEIVNVRAMKVVVHVPERDIQYMKAGAQAAVSVDHDGQDITVIGRITHAGELADEQTRSTPLEITVDNADGILRSGQIVRVCLTRRVLEDVIMIPLLAVIPFEDSRAVYVVEDGKAQRRDVELGLIRGRAVEIRSGLRIGDLLVISGHRFTGPGQRVRIVAER